MPTQRNLAELLYAYQDYLLSKVSKVRILGEVCDRQLRDVFVELVIVDQPQPHERGQFLGMVDSAMRRRFSPFADEDRVPLSDSREQREKQAKRRVKPDELLRRRTKAIVAGAPGCGKTTLLKYLALQAIDKEDRLAVWLELKAVDKSLFTHAEKAAVRYGSIILQEVWLKYVKAQLSLCDSEVKLLRAHWHEKFVANEIVVLLDGFDELQDETIERSLNKCISEFGSAFHENTLLISTRPYAQHKLGKERLQELEIEPLNQRQIEAFLNCYYPNDTATKSLLKTLRERSSLQELVNVPLLLGVILRLYREGRFTDERIELYETIIDDLINELDRSKSVSRIFKIGSDRLRLDFLKFLAFERLLRDQLSEEEPEANRIVFSYDLLKEKAAKFLGEERSLRDPRDLADDCLATPLLREVGADTFAFTHLTLQEYLAACAFTTFFKKNEFEGLRIFCRAYHNPTIVEMEVLPMTLGGLPNAERAYAEIESWPESFSYANLRLRARGLAYAPRLNESVVLGLFGDLESFVYREQKFGANAFRDMVVASFSSVSGVNRKTLLRRLESARYESELIELLVGTGGEESLRILFDCLKGEDNVRYRAVTALGRIGNEQAVSELYKVLRKEDRDSAYAAAESLGQIGGDKAIDALLVALKEGDSYVREYAVIGLGKAGGDRALETLLITISDQDAYVRERTTEALGRIGGEKAIEALKLALNDEDHDVRRGAVQSLGTIGEEQVLPMIRWTLGDTSELVRIAAVRALGRAGGRRVTKELNRILRSREYELRIEAAVALARLGNKRAIDFLTGLLRSRSLSTREKAAIALGEVANQRSIKSLIRILQMYWDDSREQAAIALGRLRANAAFGPLFETIADDDSYLAEAAAFALSQLDQRDFSKILSQFLFHEEPMLRRRAAETIGYYSREFATLGELSYLEGDPYEEVRNTAKAAAVQFARKLELLGHSINGVGQSLADNESREGVLVGEVMTIVASAGHFFREVLKYDEGIDGEIEFRNENGRGTGQRVYLQLKSGDSHLRKRKRDSKEIFTVKKRHAEYWQAHAYPVFLVIRYSSGLILWMNVTEYLRRHGAHIKQIEFQGEPFTLESVKQMYSKLA